MHHFIWSSCQRLRLLLCDGFFSFNIFFFFASYLYFTFISLGHFSGSFLVLYSFFFLSSFFTFFILGSACLILFLHFFSTFSRSFFFFLHFFFFLSFLDIFISALGNIFATKTRGRSLGRVARSRQTDDDLMKDAQTQGNLLHLILLMMMMMQATVVLNSAYSFEHIFFTASCSSQGKAVYCSRLVDH